MIPEFVAAWEKRKGEVQAAFAAAHPAEYIDIVRAVVRILPEVGWEQPDPDRITQIDHGSYSGTLVFVIGGGGYQPSNHWYVRVSYGSCSGCDTLQAIHSYDDEPPTPEQIKDYMALALHVLQGLRPMEDEVV